MMPSDRTMSNSDENVSEHSSQLETHQQRVQAVDSVLMGEIYIHTYILLI